MEALHLHPRTMIPHTGSEPEPAVHQPVFPVVIWMEVKILR